MASANRQGSQVPDHFRRRWQTPLPQCYDDMAQWGFNSYRVCLSWANLEPAPPIRAAVVPAIVDVFGHGSPAARQRASTG